jgi:uncharacterized membrane protein YphA (DoxX/SURF4 family)
VLRLILGGVLIYSGFSKAIGPTAEFAAALAAYKVLPQALIPTIAAVWPWLELLVGTYLLAGYLTRLFALVAVGMFLIFVLVLASAKLRGIDPGSCGCFGMFLTLTIGQTLSLDTLFLALASTLTVLAKQPSPYSADRWIQA